MKNKLLIIPFMMLLVIGAVTASLTFDTPTTNGRMYGTYAVNVTSTSGTLNNITNCTITIGSVSTANTSVTVILYNDSISMNNASANVVTTGYEDASDYVLAGTCYNGTATGASSATITSITGVDIDNTEPGTPSAQAPATGTTDTDGLVTFSGTVNAATTTGCSVVFTSAGKAHSSVLMTHTGSSCTASNVRLPNAVGEPYVWYIAATDGTNVTNGAATTLKVESGSNVGASLLAKNKQSQTGKINPGLLLAGVIIVVLAFKKRKSKR
jgi:hypothetical protein